VVLPTEPLEPPALHDVVVVGNNWAGTATIFDPHTFETITTVDFVPDLDARMKAIDQDPGRATIVRLIRRVAGEGNDQLVDDLFLSKDGRYLFASRPSLGDVVAIDLRTRGIAWRTDVEGFRSDQRRCHPTVRPSSCPQPGHARFMRSKHRGARSSAAVPLATSPTKTLSPRDGARIYHASIGAVFLPVRSGLFKTLKGDRWLQIVETRSIYGKCLGPESTDCHLIRCPDPRHQGYSTCIDMGEKLEHRSGAESAVRPLAVTRDERRAETILGHGKRER
jgi:hypothetical protein